MYSYTASIFWLLTWPLLIIVAFHASRFAIKKFLPLLEEEQQVSEEENTDSQAQ